MNTSVKPYKSGTLSKKKEVEIMFNKIAPNYDFLNHFLSLNIDKIWRRKAVKQLKGVKATEILDVACGTADFSIQLHKEFPDAQITGVDLSQVMLNYGQQKIAKKELQNNIKCQYGDSEDLPFDDKKFDIVTVAFGVRNFDNLSKSIKEMNRILKYNGKVLILEFSRVNTFPLKQIYSFYFDKILPRISKLFSQDPIAYKYLPESVNAFASGNKLLDSLAENGFRNIRTKKFSFGIVSAYIAEK